MSILLREAAAVLGVSEYEFRAAYPDARYSHGRGGLQVQVDSLPEPARSRFAPAPAEPVRAAPCGRPAPAPAPEPVRAAPCGRPAPEPAPALDAAASLRAEAYAAAPGYNRRRADKRAEILRECEGLSGRDLVNYVATRSLAHPGEKLSAGTIYRWRKEAAAGIPLPKYGKRRGLSNVPDELFGYFKRLYLTEGRPSEKSCYMYTVGWAIKQGYDAKAIPTAASFARRLKNETPEHAVYLARYGASAANRKYGFYIKRDYSDVLAGECWVSDHAQLDVAVTASIEGRQKTVFPWLTVMRDFKSGRWVGWYLHADAPDSDDIFMAFHRGAAAHGIPAYLYLDNGKDYRCADFAGGRRSVKPGLDKARASSMCAALGITVQYAIPYNAQTKPVERDFLLLKEWFSKHNIGYRGGNVVEKPESLNDTIKAAKILSFEEVEGHLDDFIETVTRLPLSAADWRAGKSELDLWNAEYPAAVQKGLVRAVTDAALAMFCCRTSRVMTVGRRGIRDSELGVDYYDSWMEGQKGRKVYLRRDPKAMETAWVFDAETDEMLNKAYLLPTAPALARTDIQKDMLQQNMAIRRRSNKLLRIMADAGDDIPFGEKIESLKEYAKFVNAKVGAAPCGRPADPLPAPPVMITGMDIDLAKQARRDEEGLIDVDEFARVNAALARPKETPVFAFEFEREAYEASLASAG